MKITSKIEGLEDLRNAFERVKGATDTILGPAAQAGAEVVKNSADQNAPGPHIEVEVKKVTQKKAEVKIGPDKEHWYYIFKERGAVGHTIKPRRKKALSWPGGVVVKRVNHPGVNKEPFLVLAIERNLSNIIAAISAKLRSVMK